MERKLCPPAPSYIYRALVRSVTDGDTIRLDIDLGTSIWRYNEPVRLLGVDTPELLSANRDAALRARMWLVGQLPVGQSVLIATTKDKSDKYGRYLVDVWKGPLHINAELVNLGLAKPYDGGAKA